MKTFFAVMPPDANMAFVLVVHLDPHHFSLLAELLQKVTKMPVCQVEDGMRVAPNRVYVIPPNKNLTLLHGTLQLFELVLPRAGNLPIDSFFQSLAADQKGNAVAIVLSGTGSDGSQGIRAIKGEMGMIMAQDEESAGSYGMPRSAIGTGLVDFVLPPDRMPEKLIQYVLHAQKVDLSAVSPLQDDIPNALQKIFVILRARTNHDFSQYKTTTICRRIERRMVIHQMDDISQYVRYLQETELEATILFKELLIGVTHFFRDPEAFEILQSETFPRLFAEKPDGYAIRVWVPGCAGGEEAYSVAIAMHESMERCGRHFHLQLFGTDINDEAINTSRTGTYPESIEAHVSQERLHRYFVRLDDGQYRVKKLIREMLVFAPQNIISDPPFTRLDMLSCRNLLIYLDGELQQRLFPMFHYCLKPDGILFLGSSESVGQTADLFSSRNKKWKIFHRTSSSVPSTVDSRIIPFPSHSKSYPAAVATVSETIHSAEESSALQLVETILEQSGAPPCAIVNERGDVVYIHGCTGRFLEPAQGMASLNIVEMARPGLKRDLAAGIQKVVNDRNEVAYAGLQVEYDEQILFLNVTIRPVTGQISMRGWMMVLFEEILDPASQDKRRTESSPAPSGSQSVAELEQELRFTRRNLQSTIEVLQSTNEELQSTNEELQSTNEELETSKEELQSLNEESSTMNAELHGRIEELTTTNDDMKNLLDSTEIATIFLDTQLRIRRYTRGTIDIVPLTPSDLGRPIAHLVSSLVNIDLADYGKQVLGDLAVREVAAHSKDGREFVMRVRPYRTLGNVIDGVVVTFEDVTSHRRAEQALRESERVRRLALEVGQIGVFEVDLDTGKGMWSSELASLWGIPGDVDGNFFSHCWTKVHPDDIEGVRSAFGRFIQSHEVADMAFRIVGANGAIKWIRWRFQVVNVGADALIRVVGVNHDITAQKLQKKEKPRVV